MRSSLSTIHLVVLDSFFFFLDYLLHEARSHHSRGHASVGAALSNFRRWGEKQAWRFGHLARGVVGCSFFFLCVGGGVALFWKLKLGYQLHRTAEDNKQPLSIFILFTVSAVFLLLMIDIDR